MVSSEQKRRQLFATLETAIGTEAADILMDELPPLAWSELATKADVAMLRTDMSALGQTLRAEMAAGFATLTHRLVFASMTMWVATLGMIAAMFAVFAH